MKHIAYVCTDADIPVFGSQGASIHIQSVVRAILKAGHRVTLFASLFDGPLPAGLENVTRVHLPEIPYGDLQKRAHAAMQAHHRIIERLDAHAPFDVLYERYALWSDVGVRWARAHGIPGILEVNTPLIEERRQQQQLVLEDAARRITGSAFSQASVLLAVSPGVARYLHRWPGTRGHVHIVPNGVDPAPFAVCADLRQARRVTDKTTTGETPVVIGFLGQLQSLPELLMLVDAFARVHRQLPHARLLVVGDGPARTDMASALTARGLLQYSRFTGKVDASEIPALLAQMDIATAPYPAQPEFYLSPLKICEYLAAELPVVTTQVGHLDTLVRQDVDGLLVTPDNAGAFARALTDLALDPAARMAMGRHGRQRMVTERSWDSVMAHVLALAEIVRPSLQTLTIP